MKRKMRLSEEEKIPEEYTPLSIIKFTRRFLDKNINTLERYTREIEKDENVTILYSQEEPLPTVASMIAVDLSVKLGRIPKSYPYNDNGRIKALSGEKLDHLFLVTREPSYERLSREVREHLPSLKSVIIVDPYERGVHRMIFEEDYLLEF